MLQITPQMRILVAVEAVDFRKYAPFIVMWSHGERCSKSFVGHHWIDLANCT